MSFKRLDAEDFLISSQPVSQTVWSGYRPSLLPSACQISTNQIQSPSGLWYLSVYSKTNASSSISDEEVQYDIAYANKDGLGSVPYNSNYPTNTRTKTIYGQYRTLLLEDENSTFNFGGVESNHFFVLSINRSRYKEKLLPGSFNLTLQGINNSEPLNLTDNSRMVTVPEYYGTQRVFQIIKGVNGAVSGYTGAQTSETGYTISGSYGWFLPDTGTILLNANALSIPYGGTGNQGIGLIPDYSITGSAISNMELFYSHLYDPSTAPAPSPENKGFTLNSEETITSDYIFVRTRNSEFNYSENPSFMKGSNGEVIYDNFIHNPQVYPTTVGLYNDSNDLIAVAKLSRPLLKDFTKELLLRVKIDF